MQTAYYFKVFFDKCEGDEIRSSSDACNPFSVHLHLVHLHQHMCVLVAVLQHMCHVNSRSDKTR